jgi:hypothetical protein
VGAGLVDPSPIANNVGEPAPQQRPTIKFNFVEQTRKPAKRECCCGRQQTVIKTPAGGPQIFSQ